MFDRLFEQAADEYLGRAQAIANEAQFLNLSQLPAAAAGSSVVVYVNGQPQAGTLTGTANEVSVTQTGTTITVAFDGGFILKGANTASAARTALGLGTAAVANQAAASADSAPAQTGAYVQADAQAILTELRDLKTKLRSANLLAT